MERFFQYTVLLYLPSLQLAVLQWAVPKGCVCHSADNGKVTSIMVMCSVPCSAVRDTKVRGEEGNDCWPGSAEVWDLPSDGIDPILTLLLFVT